MTPRELDREGAGNLLAFYMPTQIAGRKMRYLYTIPCFPAGLITPVRRWRVESFASRVERTDKATVFSIYGIIYSTYSRISLSFSRVESSHSHFWLPVLAQVEPIPMCKRHRNCRRQWICDILDLLEFQSPLRLS